MYDPHNVSVVICTYTEARWLYLLDALESLRLQNIPPMEIIVVVDHNPALAARVGAYSSDVIVVENRGAKGLSGARNCGIAASRGALIAFLDDDARALPDWLERLVAGYESPRIVAVGGAIDVSWLGRRPRWFPEEFHWALGCTYRGSPEIAAPVRNLIGCNMSFRREVFSEIGGFRGDIGRVEARPTGCEETEFCIRVRQAWPMSQILYLPQARVVHRMPASRGRWVYFLARCYGEGISKARVAHAVGAADGLASERKYVRKTLPAGVVRGLSDTFLHLDVFGLLRATAIVAGLAATVIGYFVGLLSITQQGDNGTRVTRGERRAKLEN